MTTEETVKLKYVGPTARPVQVEQVRAFVRREDSPFTQTLDPQTERSVEVPDRIEVPLELAVRMCEQAIWEPGDRAAARKIDSFQPPAEEDQADEPDEPAVSEGPADEPDEPAVSEGPADEPTDTAEIPPGDAAGITDNAGQE